MTSTEDDDRAVFDRAGMHVAQRVHEVPDDAWTAPTPCTEWNVREVLNHLVYEQLWARDLLSGATVEEVGSRHDGDVVGDDPVGAWDAAWAASRAAFAAVDEQATVALSRGPTPIADYRREMIIDLVVHGWDLSRGAGLDESGEPSSVRRALQIAEEQDAGGWSASGMFAPPVPVDSDDPLTRLVALLGRRP